MKLSSLLTLLAVLVILPFINPSKTLSIQILIWGLLAVSYNLLLGYTGLLSFGHSVFFGLGSYAAGLYLKEAGSGLWGGLAAGIVVAALGAAVVGWFCLRRRGVYFAMLTLAFCQMAYFLGFQLDFITGGDDGLQGVPTPDLVIPGLGSIPLLSIRHPENFYFFCLALVAVSLFLQELLVRSPFGRGLQAIRESEERSRAVGYDSGGLQWLAFVFSGGLAGLAGTMNTLYLGFVPLESLSLATSGTILMMTILGGKGVLVGPFIGAGLFLALQDYLAVYTESWPLIVGAIFVGFVLALPSGLGGGLGSLYAFITGRARKEASSA